MSYNPVSCYPNKIDEMIFFQDNDLEKVEIMNHYNELIVQGKYDESNDYISQQEGIYGFFADSFNLLENRIYATQEYLLQKPPKKQPFIYYDEEEHFSMSNLHVFHDVLIEEDLPIDDIREIEETMDDVHIYSTDINDIEEDISSITIFSDNDEQESIDGLYIFTGEEAEPPDADEDTIWI